MSPALKRGISPARAAGKSPAVPAIPVHTIGQNDLTGLVSLALHAAFGGRASPVKEIARAANANEKAAKDWWQGRTCPGALYFLRLIAAVPELQAEVRRLTGMHADLDPEFDRALQATLSLYTRVRDRKGGR